MLGGPRAFAEGGYAGTPVADVAAGRARPRRCAPPMVNPRCTHLAVAPDPGRRIARGDADRRHRGGLCGPLARPAAAHQRQSDPHDQAGRDRAAQRHRRPPPRTGRAGVAALRPRQGDRADGPGFVAVADARGHVARGPDARELLAADAPMAGGRRAGHRRCAHRHRPRRAGRDRHPGRRRRRSRRSWS